MQNPLVVIAPPDHPLTNEQQIPLQQLVKETFLIREPGSGTRLAMEHFFKEKKIRYKTGMAMSQNTAIKQAVRAGMGVAIVSKHTIELEVETGRLQILDVAEFPIMRTWHIVYPRGKRLSPAAQAFHDFVLSDNLAALSKSD